MYKSILVNQGLLHAQSTTGFIQILEREIIIIINSSSSILVSLRIYGPIMTKLKIPKSNNQKHILHDGRNFRGNV